MAEIQTFDTTNSVVVFPSDVASVAEWALNVK